MRRIMGCVRPPRRFTFVSALAVRRHLLSAPTSETRGNARPREVEYPGSAGGVPAKHVEMSATTFHVSLYNTENTFKCELQGKWLEKSLRDALLKPFFAAQKMTVDWNQVMAEVNGRDVPIKQRLKDMIVPGGGYGENEPVTVVITVDTLLGKQSRAKPSMLKRLSSGAFSGMKSSGPGTDFLITANGQSMRATLPTKSLSQPLSKALIEPFLAGYNKEQRLQLSMGEIRSIRVDGELVGEETRTSDCVRGEVTHVELEVRESLFDDADEEGQSPGSSGYSPGPTPGFVQIKVAGSMKGRAKTYLG